MNSAVHRIGGGLVGLALGIAAPAMGQVCPSVLQVDDANGPVLNQGTAWVGSTPFNTPFTAAFTITNGGCDPLVITSLEAQGVSGQKVEILEMPAAAVPAGGSTVFELYMHANQPTDQGLREIAMVTIRTNDARSDPFVFWAEGDIGFPCPPRAEFSQDGTPVNGSYDFGATRQGMPVVRSFTLTNTGCDAMTGIWAEAAGGPGEAQFEIVEPPADTLEPGQSTTFTARMNASRVGACNGDVYVRIGGQWNFGVYDDWFLLEGSVLCRADMDLNGSLTLSDFTHYRNLYSSGDMQADFNGDGSVSLTDFVVFRNTYTGACP